MHICCLHSPWNGTEPTTKPRHIPLSNHVVGLVHTWRKYTRITRSITFEISNNDFEWGWRDGKKGVHEIAQSNLKIRSKSRERKRKKKLGGKSQYRNVYYEEGTMSGRVSLPKYHPRSICCSVSISKGVISHQPLARVGQGH